MAALVAVRSPEFCDSCGAQALWRFDHNAAHLCFCKQHSQMHMRALQAAGFTPMLLVVRHPEQVDREGR